jgi:GlpG protein
MNPSPQSIWSGKYYGLIANVFLHGNFLHLAFNMLWLLRLGGALERTLKPLSWVAFFLSASVVGSCAELAVSGGSAIGASGIVYAMFGLLWAGRYYQPEWKEIATRETFWLFVGWGVLCMVASAFGYLHVANGAHAAGFLFGLAIGWAIYARRRRRFAFILLPLLAAVVILSLTWMPWSKAWMLWKASRLLSQQQWASASEHFRRSLRLGADPLAVWPFVYAAEDKLGNHAAAQEAKRRTAEALTARLQEARTRQRNR